MRILAIAFSLSLIGCVDDLASDSDPTEEALDDIDLSNDPSTDTNPSPSDDNPCRSPALGGGLAPMAPVPSSADDRDRAGADVSRKKADASCF